jgi:hypothetical protein
MFLTFETMAVNLSSDKEVIVIPFKVLFRCFEINSLFLKKLFYFLPTK